jgi:hypothetical protein
MATRKTSATDIPRKTTKRARKTTTARRAPRKASASSFTAGSFPGASPEQLVEMARMTNMLTPDQAIELYKANAKMALEAGAPRRAPPRRRTRSRSPHSARKRAARRSRKALPTGTRCSS